MRCQTTLHGYILTPLVCAGKARTLLGLEEPGVDLRQRQRELLSLTPEERHCVGGAERKARGIQGAHLAGLPPVSWRVSSMPADLGATSGQSNPEAEEPSIILKKTHAGALAGSWQAGELGTCVPKMLSLPGGSECG